MLMLARRLRICCCGGWCVAVSVFVACARRLGVSAACSILAIADTSAIAGVARARPCFAAARIVCAARRASFGWCVGCAGWV